MKLDAALWEPEYLQAFGRNLTRYHVLARQISDEISERLHAAHVSLRGPKRYKYPFHPEDRALSRNALERIFGRGVLKPSARETRASYLARNLKLLPLRLLCELTPDFDSIAVNTPADPEAQDPPSDARSASDCPTPQASVASRRPTDS